jgi:uncharacterized membrane protein
MQPTSGSGKGWIQGGPWPKNFHDFIRQSANNTLPQLVVPPYIEKSFVQGAVKGAAGGAVTGGIFGGPAGILPGAVRGGIGGAVSETVGSVMKGPNNQANNNGSSCTVM